MSVSFYLASLGDDGVTRPACLGHYRGWACDAAECADDMAHYNMCDHLDAVIAACEACSLVVNVSNHNAHDLLARLDVEFDYCGSITGADLLGRAMLGGIGHDDSGISAADVSPGVAARVIDCGRSAGYFAHRLGLLADLAVAAEARGLLVAWS